MNASSACATTKSVQRYWRASRPASARRTVGIQAYSASGDSPPATAPVQRLYTAPVDLGWHLKREKYAERRRWVACPPESASQARTRKGPWSSHSPIRQPHARPLNDIWTVQLRAGSLGLWLLGTANDEAGVLRRTFCAVRRNTQDLGAVVASLGKDAEALTWCLLDRALAASRRWQRWWCWQWCSWQLAALVGSAHCPAVSPVRRRARARSASTPVAPASLPACTQA